MKRLASLSLPVSLLVLLGLASALPSSAQAPAGTVSRPPSRPAKGTLEPVDPNKPIPGKFTHPKLKGWINDVPDTGQFLPDSVWLLRVGPRVTTVGNYVRDWFNSYPEFRPPQDSAGRVKFLKTLMQRDVLGLTATSQDRPLRFEDRLALRETRQRSLANAVFQRFVSDSVKVDERDLREMWESYKWVQHFRHILVTERALAERVRRELVSGRITWPAAVRKYSVAKNDKGPNGDLGWARRDAMEPGIAYRIFGLKPGETSQPVQDREGWHIVQSVERKPTAPPEYRAIQGAMRRQIVGERSAERSDRLIALLRVENGMVFDSANVLFAASRFRETMQVKQEAMSATFEIDGSVPEFGEQDTSRVLATWKAGRFSLGELLHRYSEVPAMLRPALNHPDAMFAFIESTVLEPGIAEYGARKGLEQDPLVAEPLRLKQEELLVEHLYQDSVASRVWVSKEDRRTYYQKNLPGFFTFPWVQFAAFTRPSKAGADSVERALRAGQSPFAMIAADSAAGRLEGSIQVRNQREEGPYHKLLFEEMRPGDTQVRGPDKTGDYAILKLISYNEGRQLSYEESEGMIDASLQNIKADEALQALIERLKKRYEFAWRPELVMLIKLLDPTLD